jgi:hypothetical protein
VKKMMFFEQIAQNIAPSHPTSQWLPLQIVVRNEKKEKF